MNKNLAIYFGGDSSEHDVSIVTGLQILNRFDFSDYNVLLVYVDSTGKMFVGKNLENIVFYKNVDYSKIKQVELNKLDKSLYYVKKNRMYKKFFELDFVINCCHGGYGENGGLSIEFEKANIPCSCGDSYSMTVSMDKCFTKDISRNLKIPIINYFVILKNEYFIDKQKYFLKAKSLGFPLVVKPARQGSSIGVCLVKTLNELENAVKLAFLYDEKLVVEKAITNKREFNIAIVRAKDSLFLSKIEEAISSSVVISFDEKYMAGGIKKQGIKNNATSVGMNNARREYPASIDPRLEEKIMSYAKKFYSAVGLNGIVRLDFIYDVDKNKIYFSEANTVPGSLGYYFFDKENLLKILIGGSEKYWQDKFELKKKGLKAKIFN